MLGIVDDTEEKSQKDNVVTASKPSSILKSNVLYCFTQISALLRWVFDIGRVVAEKFANKKKDADFGHSIKLIGR